MNCRTCNAALTGNFCSSCGRPVQIESVDWHYIVHEIRHVLHFEKGIPYTVKELLLKPGPSIHEFIRTDRTRLVKPVLFIVITSLIYSTIAHYFHIEQGYIEHSGTSNSAVGTIFTWVQDHYGYGNILMGIFIAFCLKVFYRKHDYNFFEILIMLCFVLGMGMLVFSMFSIVEGLTGLHTMVISGVLTLIYSAWAIGHFFDRKRVSSYFKAVASYVLGFVTFSISAILLGILIDWMRH